jgi:hypothetical protein
MLAWLRRFSGLLELFAVAAKPDCSIARHAVLGLLTSARGNHAARRALPEMMASFIPE